MDTQTIDIVPKENWYFSLSEVEECFRAKLNTAAGFKVRAATEIRNLMSLFFHQRAKLPHSSIFLAHWLVSAFHKGSKWPLTTLSGGAELKEEGEIKENMMEGKYLYSDLAILCPVTANKLTNHSSASSLTPSQVAKQPPLAQTQPSKLWNKHCSLSHGCTVSASWFTPELVSVWGRWKWVSSCFNLSYK